MESQRLIQMINGTFTYFTSLASWHDDPAGLQAIRDVRDQMTRELKALGNDVTRDQLTDFCRRSRSQRIDVDGPATYPPDMFIESVCQVIELS